MLFPSGRAPARDAWIADLAKSESPRGMTDGKVTFAPVVGEVVQGDRAHVVTHCIHVFKQKGRTTREDGLAAFILAKSGRGWKVESWIWASPAAK